MAAAYEPNDAGFRAFLIGPEVRRGLAEAAERAKAFAESISQDFRDSGEYAESFDVSDVTVDFNGAPRAAGRLTNTSGHAAAVEVGYRGRSHEASSSAHRVLGRTLENGGRG